MANPKQKFNIKFLLKVIKRLSEISIEENNYLSKLDLSIADKYLEEKLALTVYMSEAKKLLASNPDIRGQLSVEELADIQQSYQKLQTILLENFNLVNYSKAANKRIIDAIIRTNKHSTISVTYNKKRQKKEELVALNFLQKI